MAGHIMQSARRKGRKILVLVHRRELVRQFVDTLHKAGLDDDVGVVCSGYTPTPWAPIQVAMVFSWHRRDITFEPDIIVVDEAHHTKAKSWSETIARYPDAVLLGLTATPVRMDGKGLSPPFSAIHCGLPTPDLIAANRLCPVKVLRVDIGFNAMGVKITAGEYNRGQMDKKVDKKVVGDTVLCYHKYTPGKRAIVFAVSKRHAHEIAQRFCEQGVRAVAVGDDTPEEVRDTAFRDFASGRVSVISNVSLIDEGFDVPDCEVVIDASPTASETRYLQRCGRMMRVSESNPDKVGVLLDVCGNTYRHDLPDEARTWTLTVSDPKKARRENSKRAGELRCCPSCLAVFKPAPVCPFCGAVHDGRPVKEVDVELIEAQPKTKKPKVTKRQRASLVRYCADLVRMDRCEEAWTELTAYAKQHQYKDGWCHLVANQINLPWERRQIIAGSTAPST